MERRAFLLGILGTTVAACSSDSTATARHGTTSSGGQSSSGSSGVGHGDDGGGGPTGDDGGGGPPPPGDDGGSGFDSGTDSGGPGGPKGCAIDGGIDAGAPASFAMGTLTYVAAVPAWIGRDAGGLYALFAFCTHALGGLVLGGNQLTCSVHGAKFTLTGDLISGPTGTNPLPHYDICLNAKGNVAVDTKVTVASTTRLKA
jgi:nitrite reductase/ring-hydroxylating ferredoxin subunit